jgi:hypothetical protein
MSVISTSPPINLAVGKFAISSRKRTANHHALFKVDDAIKSKSCCGLQSVFDDATKTIHATGFKPVVDDEKPERRLYSAKNWDGETPAEPKRQRMTSSFLEGSAPALPKNFSAHQEMRPPVLPTFGGSRSCPTD